MKFELQLETNLYMRYFLLSTLLIIRIIIPSFGQYELDGNYELKFDDTVYLNHLTIDTISNPYNVWKVGQPQKQTFTEAYSYPNAIVTDLVCSYPVNDTSTFIIMNAARGNGFEMPHTVVLAGYYFVNSDTLTDYGKIEFSPDNGDTWLDIYNDTILIDTMYQFYWYWESFGGYKPVFTGNSNGWKDFDINLAVLGHCFNIGYGDTVLYRFSFISDSIQSDKDGLMFDDLHFEDWTEGIEEFRFELIRSYCYPNPAIDQVIIIFDNKDESQFELMIYESSGKLVHYVPDIKAQQVKISIDNLDAGPYYYKLSDKTGKRYTTGKFIKYQ